MSKSSPAVIRLRGVRHNNLKNFDLDLPLNQLIVITGLSGSGKSSLAFDTLFAEGQRRYIETFSPYARQFFDRMDKPQVDRIEGIPPAIAIEQRNAVRTTRSTVGTMTEICDYMKLLWPQVAHLHCRQCGRRVRKESPQQIWESLAPLASQSPETSVFITFDVALSGKMSVQESLELISKQGYQRLWLDGKAVRIDEWSSTAPVTSLTIVQDRVRLAPASRARFVEACEQAYHFGKGKLSIHTEAGPNGAANEMRFSNRLHCATCDIDYREPSPALFSFNHPVGACPACKGFGRVISIDYNLAIPDTSRTIAEGVVKPWLSGQSAECQSDLLKACRHHGVPTNVPFEQLPKKWRDFVIEGEPGYGSDEEHEWPRAWYGVKGYFKWLESRAYKMHVRVLLSRYRAYTPCPDCKGARFQPEALLYRLASSPPSGNVARPSPAAGSGSVSLPGRSGGTGTVLQPAGETPALQQTEESESLHLAAFYALPLRDSLALMQQLAAQRPFKSSDPISLVLREIISRLQFLNDVGLGYLTLDRPTRSLSGGETERVNLTTCLGTRLVNTLFVLDEPSVGLHPRDTDRLVRILEQLRDAGNTVVVVEHEASVMRAADQIIDLGPGHGATGGSIVFQGTYPEILKASNSITGQYLSGRKQIETPPRRPVLHPDSTMKLNDAIAPRTLDSSMTHWLRVWNVWRHNLRDLSADIPLARLVCVTGVSGSGKTTLVRDVLLPVVEAQLRSRAANQRFQKASDRFDATISNDTDGDEPGESGGNAAPGVAIAGFESLSRVVLVDQSMLGKTPRSNPAVYVGAFDDIREVYAQSEIARQRGFNASAFSFNSAQGQCERCRGAGFEKIEMQFLSDVFIRCPECNGRRYRSHILEIRREGRVTSGGARRVWWSIADLLEATVDEATEFLESLDALRPAQRAAASLRLLQETGLGYLKLGQPINTLSGGESQRLKLVRHLAEATVSTSDDDRESYFCDPILFLFDEPTTGLHFDDVRVLLKVFHRLVDAGHSVLVIEHNLDVIRSADWVIDLGPGAGDEGGQIVAAGTPEDIAACDASHTGRFLRQIISPEPAVEPSGRTRVNRRMSRGSRRKLSLLH